MRRPKRGINIFSLSAMDLFASAMGAFVVIAVMLFPFYQKNSPTLAQAAEMAAETERLGKETERLQQQAKADGTRAAEAEAEADDHDKRRAGVENDIAGLEKRLQTQGVSLQQCQAALGKLDIQSYDLVLAFDTTGSMDEEIEGILGNMAGIVRVMQKLVPDLRMGFVAFRDDSTYITRDFTLRQMDPQGLAQALAWLKGLSAGGSTGKLAVAKGIEVAAAMPWRAGVPRAIVAIGDYADLDGPSHRAHRAAVAFARAPRAKVSVVVARDVTGIDFFRILARAGGGEFVEDRGDMLANVLLSVIKR